MGRWKTAVLALFLVVVVAFGGFRWRAAANLEAAQQRVRDAGLPVTYAELDTYYAIPTSSDNRAFLLQFAIDSMSAGGNAIQENLPIAGQAELPHRSEPIPEEQVVAMRSFALQNLEAVETMFESFEIEECRFPINVLAGPAMTLQHLGQLRSLARVLSVRTMLAALNDDNEAATELVIAHFDLADSLEKEPILISQLVRIAIYGIGLSAAEQAMNRIAFSEDQLQRIQDRLVEGEQNRAFVESFIGERCMWTVVESVGINQSGTLPQEIGIQLFLRPSGLMDLDGLLFYSVIEESIAAYDLPVQDQITASRAISKRAEQGGPASLLTSILMPPVARSIEADVRNRAHLRTVIVALATARFKADHGTYPENADALVPEYLDAVPIDPCGGAPIRYRMLDNGFVAYSLAQNGTDENGEELEEGSHWKEGDLTFTVERPEA